MTTRNNIFSPPDADGGDGQLFDVTFSGLDGDLVVRRHRPRIQRLRQPRGVYLSPITGLEPEWEGSSGPKDIPGRSRATCRVGRFARRYDLRTHATLKFDHEPTRRQGRQRLSTFLEQVCKETGKIPYVGVAERGQIAQRLHWHVLLPADLDQEMLEYYWSYGEPTITYGNTCDDLDHLIRYLTKTFRDPDYERDYRTRYSIARGFPTTRETRRGLTQQEVEDQLRQLTATRESTIRVLDKPNPHVECYVTWAPKHIPIEPNNSADER